MVVFLNRNWVFKLLLLAVAGALFFLLCQKKTCTLLLSKTFLTFPLKPGLRSDGLWKDWLQTVATLFQTDNLIRAACMEHCSARTRLDRWALSALRVNLTVNQSAHQMSRTRPGPKRVPWRLVQISATTFSLCPTPAAVASPFSSLSSPLCLAPHLPPPRAGWAAAISVPPGSTPAPRGGPSPWHPGSSVRGSLPHLSVDGSIYLEQRVAVAHSTGSLFLAASVDICVVLLPPPPLLLLFITVRPPGRSRRALHLVRRVLQRLVQNLRPLQDGFRGHAAVDAFPPTATPPLRPLVPLQEVENQSQSQSLWPFATSCHLDLQD